MGDWSTPPVLLSIAALIVSLLSLRFVMRVDRRQRVSDIPVLNSTIDQKRVAGGWLRMQLSFHNHTETGWKIERIVFRSRDRVRTISEAKAKRPDAYGGYEFSPEHADEFAQTNTLPLNWQLAPKGTQQGPGRSGDSLHAALLLSVPASQRSVSMRVILLSSESKQRRITIAVKRAIPEVTRTTPD